MVVGVHRRAIRVIAQWVAWRPKGMSPCSAQLPKGTDELSHADVSTIACALVEHRDVCLALHMHKDAVELRIAKAHSQSCLCRLLVGNPDFPRRKGRTRQW